jgi:hypothetical protein
MEAECYYKQCHRDLLGRQINERGPKMFQPLLVRRSNNWYERQSLEQEPYGLDNCEQHNPDCYGQTDSQNDRSSTVAK